jgi:hypothetical protein
LFNEKIGVHIENAEVSGLLAVFLRGPDAVNKIEKIVGHFNP